MLKLVSIYGTPRQRGVPGLGQSFVEYVLLIGMITAALIGMQTYMKRGIQSVIKLTADQIGRQEDYEEITDTRRGRIGKSFISTFVSTTIPAGGQVKRTVTLPDGRRLQSIDSTSTTFERSTYISR